MRWLAIAIALAACHAASPPHGPAPPNDNDDSDDTPHLPALPRPIPGPHLHWKLVKVEDNRAGLAEMTWSEHGETPVWSRKPPGRLGRISMCCWSGDDGRGLDWLAPLVLADAIVLQAEGQLWVLARKDGAMVFDWSDNRTNEQRMRVGLDQTLVDEGKVVITVDGQTCASDLHDSKFVRTCGRYLVYFDRGLFALFERDPYRLVATRPVGSPMPPCQPVDVDRTIAIDRAQVRVTGQRIGSCIE